MSRHLAVPSFDGPSDVRSRDGSQHSAADSHSRHPSQGGVSHVSGSQSGHGSSGPPSMAGAPSGPQGYPQPLGYDPARDDLPASPEEMHRLQVGKRVDLPADAYIQVGSLG